MRYYNAGMENYCAFLYSVPNATSKWRELEKYDNVIRKIQTHTYAQRMAPTTTEAVRVSWRVVIVTKNENYFIVNERSSGKV